MRFFLRSICLVCGLLAVLPQASAQFGLVTCVAAAETILADQTSPDEPTGDILLTCTSPGIPGGLGSQVQANLSVTFNVDMTNPIDAPDLSDAQLIVNGNTCATPAEDGSTFGSCGAPDSRFQDPQLGRLAASNRLEWNVFSLPVPGADDGVGGTNPEVTTIRITGIRGNVAQLGVPDSAPFGTQVTAFVSITGPLTVPISNNVLNVAFPVEDPSSAPPITFGDGITCQATGSVPAVDASSFDELVGDVVLSCTHNGPAPVFPTGTVNVSISLNTNVSNATDFGAGLDVTDAILVINGNDCDSPSAAPGTTGSCGAGDERFQDPQFGRLAASNRIEWNGVQFPIPGADDGDGGTYPFRTTIRIRNLRSNVAQLGVPESATFPSTQVTGFLAMTGVPLTNNVLNLAAPIVGAPTNTTVPAPSLGTTTCQATAVPPVIRAEGIAEATGDIVYICSTEPPPGGFTSGTAVMDFTVSLNTAITNNVGFGPGADITDAVMIINENNCISPAAAGSTFGGCQTPDPRFQDPQFGRLAAPNRVEWKDVSFPFTGAPDGMGGVNPLQTTVRFTGIRSNASGLGVPNGATFPSTQVTAFSTVQGEAAMALTNNVLNVAVPIVGLIVDVEEVTGLRCVQFGSAPVRIQIQEGFATAWKTNGIPTFTTGPQAWESTYHAPGSNDGGGASQATRFRIHVETPIKGPFFMRSLIETDGRLKLRLIEGADANGAEGTPAPDEPQFALISANAGDVFDVIYEVVDSDLFAIEDVEITIGIEDPGVPLADYPEDPVVVSVSFAPFSEVTTADNAAPEPRFGVSNESDPADAVFFRECETTLLFPFVTSAEGEDTRVVIANGNGLRDDQRAQAGACTMDFIRHSGPDPAVAATRISDEIPVGGRLEFPLNAGNAAQGINPLANFEGYMVANCDFDRGVGKAVVSDGATFAESEPEVVSYLPIEERPEDDLPLLFPYVSNRDDRDTEIFIANTVAPMTYDYGFCSIEYVGQGAPASQSVRLDYGEGYLFRLSEHAPGFEGGVVVDCEFPLLRGYARVFGADPSPYAFGVDAVQLDDDAPLLSPGEPFRFVGVTDNNRTTAAFSFVNLTDQPQTCEVYYRDQPLFTAPPLPDVAVVPARSQVNLPVNRPGVFTGLADWRCSSTGVHGFLHGFMAEDGEVISAYSQEPDPIDTGAESIFVPKVGPRWSILPFAESMEGSDRKIFLSNGLSDPFVTSGGEGVDLCTLSYHGQMTNGQPLPPDAELELAGGETVSFDLFQGDPRLGVGGALGFRGFILSQCVLPLTRTFDYRTEVAEASAPTVCEVDENEGVDRRDVQLIRQARGQSVEEGDPRDFDGDGRITNNDRNQCRARCTLPNCALVQD